MNDKLVHIEEKIMLMLLSFLRESGSEKYFHQYVEAFLQVMLL
jgi:hypothetical protein